MRLRSVVALLLLLFGAPADAASLAQPADHFWAVLASRQDADEAIAAQLQADVHAVVTRASNGWFAAISGPYTVKAGTGRAFLDGLIKDHGAPADAYLTRGANFDAIAWKAPATNVSDTVSYDGEHDVSFRRGDLTLKLSRQRADGDQFSPTLAATYQGRPAFSLAVTENSSEKPASRVDLVRLDPASPLPQIVFTYYWQGAHCCTVTKIASLAPSGAWNIIDGETLDGDGYSFEDLGGGYASTNGPMLDMADPLAISIMINGALWLDGLKIPNRAVNAEIEVVKLALIRWLAANVRAGLRKLLIRFDAKFREGALMRVHNRCWLAGFRDATFEVNKDTLREIAERRAFADRNSPPAFGFAH